MIIEDNPHTKITAELYPFIMMKNKNKQNNDQGSNFEAVVFRDLCDPKYTFASITTGGRMTI